MQHRHAIIEAYNRLAGTLAQQYDTVRSQDVLVGLEERLPRLCALDVACGTGRDAEWLAQHGFRVTAIDGAEAMLAEARAKHSHPFVTYQHDLLPELAATRARGQKYDLILMSAAWMHIAPERRAEALTHLLDMANPGCLMFISLRHGPAPADRKMFEVDVEELRTLAARRLVSSEALEQNSDQLGRSAVWWDTVYLKVPATHQQELQLIREAALNDRMRSTYKPTLMMALAHHHQAITPQSAAQAALPFGPLAAFWQTIYGAEPLWKTKRCLTEFPLRRIRDPETDTPLFMLEETAQGLELVMPRPLAAAMKSHAPLIEAGARATLNAYQQKLRAPSLNLCSG